MNPLTPITKWQRKQFDTLKPEDADNRTTAETETSQDLQKPIQQLLCDAHEEAQRDRLVGVNKRMTALLTITAYESRITSWWIKWLTFAIVVLTSVLVWMELRR